MADSDILTKITNLAAAIGLDVKTIKTNLAALVSRNIYTSGGLTGGGDLSADRTISLADSGITPGTYTKLTVNTKGIATASSSVNIDDVAGFTVGTNKIIYVNGSSGIAQTDITAAGRSMIGAADAAAQRGLLSIDFGTAFQNTVRVGDWGLGYVTPSIATDLNALAGCQWFRWGTSTSKAPTGVGLGTSGVGIHLARSMTANTNDVQVAYDTTGRCAVRACTSGTWGSWVPVYSGNNPIIYNTTVPDAANVVVSSTGVLSRTSSSIRYKKKVVNLQLEDSYNVLRQLRPVEYEQKGSLSGKKYIGLIAEEVMDVDRRLVATSIEAGKEVAEDVAYARIVPHLLNVIADLEQRIKKLEKE